MKSKRSRYISIKLLSSISGTLVFYMALQAFFSMLGISAFSKLPYGDNAGLTEFYRGLSWVLATSVIGYLFSELCVIKLKPSSSKAAVIAAGAAASLLAGMLSGPAEAVAALLRILAFMAVWGLALRKAYIEASEAFTVKKFFIELCTAAFAAFFLTGEGMGQSSSLLLLFFTIISLYGLARLKRLLYAGRAQSGKTAAIETLMVILAAALIFIISSPNAAAAVIGVLGALYEAFAKLLITILTPVADLLARISVFVARAARGNNQTAPDDGPQVSEGEIPEYNLQEGQSFLERYLDIALIILLAVAAILIVRFVWKRLGSKSQNEAETNYIEDRESVFDIKDSFQKRFKNLARLIEKGRGFLSYRELDNRGKLRHHYARLIELLHRQGIIPDRGLTARRIAFILTQRCQASSQSIEKMTSAYEEVRYGMKLPQTEEIEAFRQLTGEIRRQCSIK